MAEIPTAKAFLESLDIEGSSRRCKAMIEFAKMHVEAALKAANENAYAQSSSSNITSKDWNGRQGLICVHLGIVSVNKDSILNSYPLSNIK